MGQIAAKKKVGCASAAAAGTFLTNFVLSCHSREDFMGNLQHELLIFPHTHTSGDYHQPFSTARTITFHSQYMGIMVY